MISGLKSYTERFNISRGLSLFPKENFSQKIGYLAHKITCLSCELR